MKKFINRIATACLIITASALSIPNAYAVKIGESVPLFSGMDSNGKSRGLTDYLGKWIVLEWHNKDCPFVKRQYDSGNIQKLQKKWTKEGVVWLSIISSAKGKQGYVNGKEANLDVKKHRAAVTATLLDPSGIIGQAFGAKTTPHMFVINPQGKLVYDGALDNRPNAEPATKKTDVTAGEGAYINYVDVALDEAKNQEKPALSNPTTTPYGCGVKYSESAMESAAHNE